MTDFEGAQKQVTGAIDKYLNSEDNAENRFAKILHNQKNNPWILKLVLLSNGLIIICMIWLFSGSKFREDVAESKLVTDQNHLKLDSIRKTQDSFMKAKKIDDDYQKNDEDYKKMRDSLFKLN